MALINKLQATENPNNLHLAKSFIYLELLSLSQIKKLLLE
jgi:hypothetical protein